MPQAHMVVVSTCALWASTAGKQTGRPVVGRRTVGRLWLGLTAAPRSGPSSTGDPLGCGMAQSQQLVP